VGGGEHERYGTAGFDPDRERTAGLDRKGRCAVQRESERPPGADEHVAAPRRSWRAARHRQARVELDARVHRSAIGGQAAHYDGSRKQPLAGLGHHAVGERQARGRALPHRFERGGVGQVTPLSR